MHAKKPDFAGNFENEKCRHTSTQYLTYMVCTAMQSSSMFCVADTTVSRAAAAELKSVWRSNRGAERGRQSKQPLAH